jgi:hypothetical protein
VTSVIAAVHRDPRGSAFGGTLFRVDDQPTTLWALRREGRQVACLARLVSYGIEIDIAYDGEAVVTRTFETGDEALAWAEKKRAEREAQGWSRP